MTPRKSTPLLLAAAALLTLFSCNGLSTKNHPPLIFALNLSSNAVSLILSKDDSVMVDIPDLKSLESRSLVKIPDLDGVVLRHGVGGQAAETEWTDPSGTPYSLKFQQGGLYAIVVDPLGQAAVYTLPETFSSQPKLCIVNASPATLSQVQAAPDWAKNVKVYSQDLAPVVPTEFYSLDAKTLGLYWQTLEQVADGDHVTARGLDGKPLRQAFLDGHYYLFLAGEGSVRDLTPTTD